MNKFWVFVEGDSEEEFIINLLRRRFSDRINVCKDLSEFVKIDLSNANYFLAFIENCSSIDKLPHRINEIDYLISRSGTDKIMIIGDLERLPCYSNRKNQILGIFNNNISLENLKMVFSKPMIETQYWDCPELISRIVKLEYRRIYQTPNTPEITIPNTINHNIFGLKQLFKKYNVKYRESRFSEMFFPRVNFGCQNNTLIRTITFIEEFIEP